VGMTPACAQACPTASIQFGSVRELRQRADARVTQLQGQGTQSYIYGNESMLGGLNAFFLLTDRPSVYGLPDNPRLPTRNSGVSWLLSAGSAAVAGVIALLSFRRRRMEALVTPRTVDEEVRP
jgi:formate dehydrogenase iron-sulfur subunit